MEGIAPQNPIRLGQMVYLVESCRTVREAVVRSRSGGLYTVRFADSGGGIRVRGDRLYPTREAAADCVRQRKAASQLLQPPSNLWHSVPVWQC